MISIASQGLQGTLMKWDESGLSELPFSYRQETLIEVNIRSGSHSGFTPPLV
jgi:hypothetical protein